MTSQLTDDVLAKDSVRTALASLFACIPHGPQTQAYEKAVETITHFAERMVEIASCAKLPKATKRFSVVRSEAATTFRSEQQPNVEKTIKAYNDELSRQGVPNLSLESLASEVMTETLRLV